jgi:hypothetical protein
LIRRRPSSSSIAARSTRRFASGNTIVSTFDGNADRGASAENTHTESPPANTRAVAGV